MGQKVNPTGLRVGVFRKWNTTWFAEKYQYKFLFYAQHQIEQFLRGFFHFYSYTKNSASKKAALVDLKWFRAGNSQLYFFVFFYKFRTKKRRWGVRFILRKRKIMKKKPKSYWQKAVIQHKNLFRRIKMLPTPKINNFKLKISQLKIRKNKRSKS